MRFVVAALVICLAGCATYEPAGSSSLLTYPNRTIADWNPERAAIEAQQDLATGSPKIYLSGTIVALAPGIDPQDYPLVSSLPKADAGIGCLIADGKFRRTQFEYAARYNAVVAAQLKAKANQSPLPTPASVTPAVNAPVAPPAGVAGL